MCRSEGAVAGRGHRQALLCRRSQVSIFDLSSYEAAPDPRGVARVLRRRGGSVLGFGVRRLIRACCAGEGASAMIGVRVPALVWVSSYLGDPSSPTYPKLGVQHQLPLENTQRRPTNSACLPKRDDETLGPAFPQSGKGQHLGPFHRDLCPGTPERGKSSPPCTRWDQLYPFASERGTMGKLLPAASYTTPLPNQVPLQWWGWGGLIPATCL